MAPPAFFTPDHRASFERIVQAAQCPTPIFMSMEERKLTSKLFGNLGEQLLVLRPTVEGPAANHGDGVDETGAVDTAATDTMNGVGAPDAIADASFTREHSKSELKGAWEDPDDVGTIVNVAKRARLRKLREDEGEAELDGKKYQQRVRTQHKRIHPRTDWADLETPGLLGNNLTVRDTEEKSIGLNRLLRRWSNGNRRRTMRVLGGCSANT